MTSSNWLNGIVRWNYGKRTVDLVYLDLPFAAAGVLRLWDEVELERIGSTASRWAWQIIKGNDKILLICAVRPSADFELERNSARVQISGANGNYGCVGRWGGG